MRSLLPFVLLTSLSSVLGTRVSSRDYVSIYDRNLLDSEHNFRSGARAVPFNSYGNIYSRHVDNNDDIMRQHVELQQQLQKVVSDLEAVREIQTQQLDLMKQQHKKSAAKRRKRQIGRRSMHARATPPTPQQQQQQMITAQQKQIAQQQWRDKDTQQRQLQQQAEAMARTPGAGVGAGATILKIVPGVSA